MALIKNERLVKVKAVDWGYWDDPGGYEIKEGAFKTYIGWLHGQVIEETDEYIAIGHETFEGNKVRKTTSIPKSAILEIIEFKRQFPIPEGQQSCKRCQKSQYFEYSIKDKIWQLLPEKWISKALCIDCFIEEIDGVLGDVHKLSLRDFDYIGIVGNKLRMTILDKKPKRKK